MVWDQTWIQILLTSELAKGCLHFEGREFICFTVMSPVCHIVVTAWHIVGTQSALVTLMSITHVPPPFLFLSPHT